MVARAQACKPSPLRDAFLKNLRANAFVDKEHAKANLLELERQSGASR
jgi:hypothetical protein